MVSGEVEFLVIGDNEIIEDQIYSHFSCNPSEHMRAIVIRGNNSIVRNCTLIGFYINVQIIGDNNTVENNTLVGACDGVQVAEGSRNSTIRNNYFDRNNYSIVVWQNSKYTSIYNNTFYQTTHGALDIRKTSNVTIYNNSFVNNRYNYIFTKGEKLFDINRFDNYYCNNLGNETNWEILYKTVQRNNSGFIVDLNDDKEELYDQIYDLQNEIYDLNINLKNSRNISYSLLISTLILISIIGLSYIYEKKKKKK